MMKKLINFINSKLFEKMICFACYSGILGLIIMIIIKFMNKEDEEKFIYCHSKNATVLFMILMFSVPLAKIMNKFFFYLLSPQLNILLMITYSFCIYKLLISLKSIRHNEIPPKFI